MRKMNKILLFSFFLILLSSFASALTYNDSNVEAYYSFDNGSLLDSTNNNHDLTIGNAPTESTGIINVSYDFTLDTNYFFFPDMGIFDGTTNNFSINYWVNPDTVSDRLYVLNMRHENSLIIEIFDGVPYVRLNQGGWRDGLNYLGSSIPISTWSMVTINYDTVTGWEMFINAVSVANDTTTGTIAGEVSGTNNRMGCDITSCGNGMDGDLDEVSMWTKTLSSSEITELYNGGSPTIDQQFPFVEEEVEEILENTAIAKQTGTIQISNINWQTIVSSSYEVIVNNTPIYGAYSFNIAPNNNNVMTCQLLIDGVQQGNVTRTNIAGETGSVFMQSPIFIQVLGNYTQELQCRKDSGPGNFVISKAVGIGHLLFSEHKDILNYDENNFLATATSGSSTYELLDQHNFTMNTHHINAVNTIVVDWSATYTNNHVSAELLNTYIQINGTNCSSAPRTVSSGGIGSVGGSCVINDLSINSTITINYYGLGTNADYQFFSTIKEFNHDENEVKSSDITGQTFNGSGYQLIKTLTVDNNNHALANLFTKISLSLNASASTNANFYFNASNGVIEQSIIHSRDLTTSTGRVIFHDIIESLSTDNYTIEVYADCGGADCTVQGGEITSYITDTTAVILNEFTTTIYDNYDDTLINQTLTITLPDGNIVTGINGIVTVSDEEDIINATIITANYFDSFLINHNTTLDVNISMNQTLISWDCIEKVSGLDLNCTSPTESEVFNYNVAGNEHSQSLNVTGYYENIQSFNVTALDNETINSTPFYSTNLTLQSTTSISGASISNCTYNVTSLDYSWTESVSGTPNSSVGLINGSYSIVADCIGFAYETQNVTIENITQTITFNLFTTNSVNLTFYDSETGNILNTTTITVTFIGSTAQTNTTTTGTLYIDLLNPSEYTILSESNNYRQTSYIFTLDDRDNININIWMEKTNQTQLVLISVKDKFSKDPIQNALVTIQKYRDNAWVTDQIISTDFQGFTEAHFVLSSENTLAFYNFFSNV